VLERLSQERRGLILVTGITGSGKSTTLAAMLDYMNRTRNDHIVTIEDPVEFVHEDKKCVISQREIGQDSTSFAQALRAALRQDPDIILVGEMRDAETMEVAINAAETGHLVLSTPPHAETPRRPSTASSRSSRPIRRIRSAPSSPRSSRRGVPAPRRAPPTARTRAAVEVMIMTGLVRESIREKAKTPQIPRSSPRARRSTACRPSTSPPRLYREELVTYETARDAATNPDDFDLKVKGIFSTGEMTWDSSSDGLEASKPTGAKSVLTKPPAWPSGPEAVPPRGRRTARGPGNGGSWTRRPPSWRPSSFWRAKRGARVS